MRRVLFLLVMSGIGIGQGFAGLEIETIDLRQLQKKAEQFGDVLTLPPWERSVEAIQKNLTRTIQEANAGLDRIGRLSPEEVTFENTVRALDDVLYEATLFANRVALIKSTYPDAAMRKAATEALKKMEEWFISVDYREDIYRAIKALAAKHPKLAPDEQKYLTELLRDYRRAGFELPPEDRKQVEQWRKELAQLGTDFENNILNARKPLKFTRAELEGVPEDFLNQKEIHTGPDEYTILANVTYQYITVMENARREDVRRRLCEARFRLAMNQNVPLLRRILELREKIAHKLGYANWADYRTEVRMAKTGERALQFCEELTRRLAPRFQQELELMRRIKVAETHNPKVQVRIWDWRYLANRIKQTQYHVDTEALRVYFPYDRVLRGMLEVFGEVFGLRFYRVEPDYKWTSDLQLIAVVDAQSGEPLGLLYLDMFPREGKYNHFAQFDVIGGKLLRNGRYQRPVAALICNFPTPQPDRPSLLTHDDVETIFHEFGHALHTILTRARFARFAGTSVPRDFVEVPSQVLEAWAWRPEVLERFAADYRDPSRKIPASVIEKLRAARLATIGSFYRRQMAFALSDLELHMDPKAPEAPAQFANRIFSRVFLPVPPHSAFVAYFGHLVGYDASYYGYAWADVIAEDIDDQFERAPHGFLDHELGARLRKEIYEVGDSRPAEVSIRKFLGRDWNMEAFLRRNGLLPTQSTEKPQPSGTPAETKSSFHSSAEGRKSK